jgi:hypothetical protein
MPKFKIRLAHLHIHAVTYTEELRISDQGSTVEATVAQHFNQAERTNVLYIIRS